MHKFLRFIFGIKLYMFRTFPLSNIRSFSLYAVKNSLCWTEELSEKYRVLFQKQTWEISASSWFYCKNTAQLLYRVFQCVLFCALSQVSYQETSCCCGVLPSLLFSLHNVLGQHVQCPVAIAEVVNVAFTANFCIMFFVWELLKPNLKLSPSAIWVTEKFSRRNTSCSCYLWSGRLLGRGLYLVWGNSVIFVDKMALEHDFLRLSSFSPAVSHSAVSSFLHIIPLINSRIN